MTLLGFFPMKSFGSNFNLVAGGVFQTVGLCCSMARLVMLETEAGRGEEMNNASAKTAVCLFLGQSRSPQHKFGMTQYGIRYERPKSSLEEYKADCGGEKSF